jgi:hypothetical protein
MYSVVRQLTSKVETLFSPLQNTHMAESISRLGFFAAIPAVYCEGGDRTDLLRTAVGMATARDYIKEKCIHNIRLRECDSEFLVLRGHAPALRFDMCLIDLLSFEQLYDTTLFPPSVGVGGTPSWGSYFKAFGPDCWGIVFENGDYEAAVKYDFVMGGQRADEWTGVCSPLVRRLACVSNPFKYSPTVEHIVEELGDLPLEDTTHLMDSQHWIL